MQQQTIVIKPPNFSVAQFKIKGTAPLVVHRFSAKLMEEFEQKIIAPSKSAGRKKREPQKPEDIYEAGRYRSAEGWDGFNAAGVRKALISACRLVNFKMTLAKLSLFIEADGVDKDEPQIPLVRIIGDPIMQRDMGRVATGEPYLMYRPAYHNWAAMLRVRFDADQFTLADVTNLLARVGMQVGLCEGRPDSTNSPGMGWGLFDIEAAQ